MIFSIIKFIAYVVLIISSINIFNGELNIEEQLNLTQSMVFALLSLQLIK